MATPFEGGLSPATLYPQYQFTVHRAVTGQFYFSYRDKGGNVEAICWSEMYTTKENCVRAIETVKNGAATADLVDQS